MGVYQEKAPQLNQNQPELTQSPERKEFKGETIWRLFENGSINALPVSMAVLNPAGRVVIGNTSYKKLFGLPTEDAEKEVFIQIPAKEGEKNPLDQLIQGEIESHDQQIKLEIENEEKWLKAHITAQEYCEGTRILVTGFSDITDEMVQILDLQQRREQIEENVATVRHDLKNPLQAIRGYGQLLDRSGELDRTVYLADEEGNLKKDEEGNPIKSTISEVAPRVERFVGVARSAAERNFEITQRLQDIEYLPKKESLDMIQVLESSLKRRRKQDQLENINVETRFPESTPQVMADPSYMETIFDNLFINAIHAMDGQSLKRLSVRCKVEETAMIISVSDTGHGILPEDMPKIWNSKYTTKRGTKFEGTGRGLHDVARMVGSHGWTIRVRSLYQKVKEENPELYQFRNHGTIFRIRIPLPVKK
ncbi:MAG: hypothetical protein A2857_00100 [Candidatus Levybacteria bacterium RIFCSPHIGHO2_01_FULL_36_15]|nr:MAG: hypothetical protein A2857_00100 [Candidatus Levybacteria bacterium RIFCSPHIGHO2_01_FULL_36_15]